MLMLFTTICENTIEDTICSIYNLEDEDFNGNNGDEYVSDTAKDNGFRNDREYIIDKLQHAYASSIPSFETLQSIVNEYCDYFFGLSNYYTNYQISMDTVENNLFISVAYTTQD